MKILSLASSLLALAVCAGCAMDQGGTTSMGAGPGSSASSESMLYCKDGAHVPKSVGCGAGVEREMSPASTSR